MIESGDKYLEEILAIVVDKTGIKSSTQKSKKTVTKNYQKMKILGKSLDFLKRFNKNFFLLALFLSLNHFLFFELRIRLLLKFRIPCFKKYFNFFLSKKYCISQKM